MKKIVVSIIIPVYNNLFYTRQCLQNIWCSVYQECQIIIVNNGSTDGTKDFLASNSRLTVIHNSKNYGFSQAINQGLAIAEGEYVVIINNDCLVFRGWLDSMIKATTAPARGLVGVMSNYISSPQLLKTDKPLNDIYMFAEKIKRQYSGSVIETNRIVGICVLIKRKILEKIGGFDTRFSPGGFEDDDYSLRVKLLGLQNVVCRDVFVYHYGSTTLKKEIDNYSLILERNWKLFKKKWSIPSQMNVKEYKKKDLNFNFSLNQENIYIPL